MDKHEAALEAQEQANMPSEEEVRIGGADIVTRTWNGKRKTSGKTKRYSNIPSGRCHSGLKESHQKAPSRLSPQAVAVATSLATAAGLPQTVRLNLRVFAPQSPVSLSERREGHGGLEGGRRG